MDGVIYNEEYKVDDDLIYYKDSIFLVFVSEIKKGILEVVHNAPVASHPGFLKTYQKVRERFT